MRFGSIVQGNWDWRAAGNIMLGGTGGSLMFMIAAISFPDNPPAALVLVPLVIVGVGLGLVWTEIGRPWRFLNVFFHPQTSWMTREAVVAVVFFAFALAGAALRQAALIALAGLGGLAFLYCQAMMLRAAKGIPAWRVAAIVPLIVATGLSEGAALLVLILLVTAAAPSWLIYLLLALVVVRTMAWQHYLAKLAAARAPKATLDAFSGINWNAWVVGGALPVALLLLPLGMPAAGALLISLAAALVVLTGWHLKFTIVTRAHVQGFALPVPSTAA